MEHRQKLLRQLAISELTQEKHMFASYVDYLKNVIAAMNKKDTHAVALSFVNYATKRNTTNDEQTKCSLPEITWTNGTTEGWRKGLSFIREKVQRIFVLRRLLKPWRLSELS